MESIRVERLRCLSDTGNIQIKPITVLLGQNSSGKSTFLRVFPLLKQSAESRTTGPILWNGRLVDFGSYEDAHQNGTEESISFSFNFQIQSDDSRFVYDEDIFYVHPARFSRILHNIDISLTLVIAEDKKRETTRTKKISLALSGSKIEIDFAENGNISGFFVNSLNLLKSGNKYAARQLSNKSILPTIVEIEPNRELESQGLKLIDPFLRFQSLGLLEPLIKKTQKIAHPSTSLRTISNMVSSFSIGTSETMLRDIQNNRYAVKSWIKKTANWTVETAEFQELRDLIIASKIPSLFEKCDEILGNISRQISYMGPARATAERYYRTQDLAVDEVDYQGRNLAMFLRNLTEPERKNFESWTLRYFGFAVLIETSLGHISIKIRYQKSDRKVNVADTGFGFSQILPIITQLWLLTTSPRRNSQASRRLRKGTLIFSIEQPELHLHPRLQGILTDAFISSIKAASKQDVNLRLIIETHSEILVNRLGHLVARGKVSPEDINVVFFEQLDESGETSVRTINFNADGYLSNWPIGFFDMDLDWDAE